MDDSLLKDASRAAEEDKAGDSPQKLHSAAVKDINLQKICDRAWRLKVDLVDGFERQLQELVDDFVQDVERCDMSTLCIGAVSDTVSVKKNTGGKQFVERCSVLSELLEISHIRTIYHIFVAILIVFMLNTFVYDFMEHGRIVLDFNLIFWTFGKFPIVISTWMVMMFSTALVVFISFQYWSYNRRPGKAYWVDYIWLLLFIVYQVAFLVLPVRTVITNQLPTASTVVVLTEQVRMVMKVHAFVRENIPRALTYNKTKADDTALTPCPDFSKYLYFLFAPTLIYRDTYPRTKGAIRWNYVVSNFAQVLASLFYIYYIFERFCIPVFRNFTNDFISPRRLIISIFGCMLPGTLMLFIVFFAILHSWLNAFAEMLRFADRLFYKDWWNSASFANYYRTWNLVVHDWLYTYIYKDMCLVLGNSNRPIAMACVFLVSALFHEYILSVTFGFIYPVLFVMFAGAGFAFIFVPSKSQRSGNVFMWVALFIGTGVLMCLYSLEWYARITCHSHSDSFSDYLIPRSWTCGYIGRSPLTDTALQQQQHTEL